MFHKLLSYCAALSPGKVVGIGLILGVVFEAITVALRFGFNLESTRDTATAISTSATQMIGR